MLPAWSCAVDYKQDIDKAEQRLIDAIRSHEEGAILELLDEPTSFMIGPQLRPEIAQFLWNSDTPHSSGRTIQSVAALIRASPVMTVRTEQTDGSIIVIFIPERFTTLAQTSNFYRQQWMKKYFSCRFKLIGDLWKIIENVCFAETDGPFPPDYG